MAKQAPRRVGSIVPKEVCCTTKELIEFADPFKQSGISVGMDFKGVG